MEWLFGLLFGLGAVWIGYKAISANWANRYEEGVKEANDELQAYYDSLSQNNNIDDKLDDERVQHVQDRFND